MKAKTDHVVLNANTQRIECLHCGRSEPLLPGFQRIEVQLAHWKSFGAEHKGCKTHADLDKIGKNRPEGSV